MKFECHLYALVKSLSHGHYWIQACPQLRSTHTLIWLQPTPSAFYPTDNKLLKNTCVVNPPLHSFSLQVKGCGAPSTPTTLFIPLACVILYYTVLYLYLYWSSNIILAGQTSAFQGRRMKKALQIQTNFGSLLTFVPWMSQSRYPKPFLTSKFSYLLFPNPTHKATGNPNR
jgi:hypothetical protein